MLSAKDFLAELQCRGARRVRRVYLRDNRNVIWSLTQQGTVLNVHAAYGAAPPELLDAFALLAKAGGVGSAVTRRAASTISAWPDVWRAVEATRASHRVGAVTSCCATPEQRNYLRALYRYFNVTRFAGDLPDDIPVRLSHRMVSALGNVDGTRRVEEIAINVDLMLERNGAERIDTLLHEMAHVADYLQSGHRGHGASWKGWAHRAGCRPTRLYDRPVARRRRRRDPVRRVPPLPASVARLVSAS